MHVSKGFSYRPFIASHPAVLAQTASDFLRSAFEFVPPQTPRYTTGGELLVRCVHEGSKLSRPSSLSRLARSSWNDRGLEK